LRGRWSVICILSRGGANPADRVFLFSYFVRTGEDGLHLAVSEGGLKWTVLHVPRAVVEALK
jgi:hypothetical protein